MLKNHLNVDFTEDDSYITALADAAEDYVEIYTNRPISEFLDESGEKFRPAIQHAVNLLVGEWYANREAVTHTTNAELPYGTAALLIPFKKYR